MADTTAAGVEALEAAVEAVLEEGAADQAEAVRAADGNYISIRK
jgi:hypothetical protein